MFGLDNSRRKFDRDMLWHPVLNVDYTQPCTKLVTFVDSFRVDDVIVEAILVRMAALDLI